MNKLLLKRISSVDRI